MTIMMESNGMNLRILQGPAPAQVNTQEEDRGGSASAPVRLIPAKIDLG